MVCHSLVHWTTFCQNSPPWPFCLGWTYMVWFSFIELDNAVVHVIRLVSFCDCGFILSALWCPLSAPNTLVGLLLLLMLGISSQMLQQSAATAPYLGHGVSLHSRCWPCMWVSPPGVSHSRAVQPLLAAFIWLYLSLANWVWISPVLWVFSFSCSFVIFLEFVQS